MTQPQRHRQTTAERLDQAPMLVWFPEWPEMGELPALPSSPLERRTQRRFPSNNWHLSASVTLLRTSLGQRKGQRLPCRGPAAAPNAMAFPLAQAGFRDSPPKIDQEIRRKKSILAAKAA